MLRFVEGGRTRLTTAEVDQAGAIVVLSGAVMDPPGDNDVLEWSSAVDRFEGGLALFRAGKAPYLIYTRGELPWQPHARPEGEVLAEWATDRGIPKESILLTGSVVNTAAEAQAVAKLMSEHGMANRSVLLVTSAFHMRRAMMLFEKASLTVLPYPVDFRAGEGGELTVLDLLPSADSMAASELALREYYGYIYYRLLQ